jgi:hypothetical protein
MSEFLTLYGSASGRVEYMDPESTPVVAGEQQQVVYVTPAGRYTEHVTVAESVVEGRTGYWVVQTFGTGKGYLLFAQPTQRATLADGSKQVMLFPARDAGDRFELKPSFGMGRLRARPSV